MSHTSLFIKNDRWYIKLPYSEVLYIEAEKKYIKIVTPKRKYLLLATIGEVEVQLPASEFCRVHRSFIVSLHSITAFNHELVKLGEKEFPVGRLYKDMLRKMVNVLLTKNHR